MRVLILEDEPKAAIELQKMVEAVSESIHVVAKLQSVAESVEWLLQNQSPDLILSDIQLLDGLSFELFHHCALEVPVIFCTAYDEYALTAFANNGIDYLLKPIEQSKLASSIEKLYRIGDRFNRVYPSYSQRLQSIKNQLIGEYTSSLIVYHRNRIIPIKVHSIRYLYLRNGLVHVCTGDNDYALNQTLDSIGLQLNPLDFYRANRSFIIHRNSITTVEFLTARKLGVNLSPALDELVVISKAKASDFMRWLEGNREYTTYIN